MTFMLWWETHSSWVISSPLDTSRHQLALQPFSKSVLLCSAKRTILGTHLCDGSSASSRQLPCFPGIFSSVNSSLSHSSHSFEGAGCGIQPCPFSVIPLDVLKLPSAFLNCGTHFFLWCQENNRWKMSGGVLPSDTSSQTWVCIRISSGRLMTGPHSQSFWVIEPGVGPGGLHS